MHVTLTPGRIPVSTRDSGVGTCLSGTNGNRNVYDECRSQRCAQNGPAAFGKAAQRGSTWSQRGFEEEATSAGLMRVGWLLPLGVELSLRTA